jgi:hypothetical protein
VCEKREIEIERERERERGRETERVCVKEGQTWEAIYDSHTGQVLNYTAETTL